MTCLLLAFVTRKGIIDDYLHDSYIHGGPGMTRRLLLLAGTFLLAGCATFSTSSQPAPQTLRGEGAAITLYAQARLAWNEGDDERVLQLTKQGLSADPNSVHLLELQAEALLKQSRPDEAMLVIDKAIAVAPDFRPPYVLGGSVMTSLGKTKEAIVYLRHATRLDPTNEEGVLHLVTSLLQLFEYEEAVTSLKQLIINKPDSFLGNYYLGKVYSQMKLYKESIGYYQRALELKPDFAQAAIDMAISLEASGQIERAITAYKSVLNETDNRTPVIKHLVQLFIQKRKYEEALVYLKKLADMGLANAESNRKTGLIYMELQRFDEAITVFNTMLKNDPEAHQIRLYLGSAYEEKGEITKALEVFLAIPKDDVVYSDTVTHIASLYQSQRKYDLALQILEEAIGNYPSRSDLFLAKSSVLEAMRKPNDALKVLLQVEQRFSADARFQFRLGALYERLGKPLLAIQRMKRVVEINPRDAQAHNFIGYTYAEMGDPAHLSLALTHIKRALELKPNDGYFIDSLGWVYYQMKRYDEAVKHLEKASSLIKDDATILEHLADAYLARKDHKAAMKTYRKVRTLEPKNKRIEDKIKQLQPLCDAEAIK